MVCCVVVESEDRGVSVCILEGPSWYAERRELKDWHCLGVERKVVEDRKGGSRTLVRWSCGRVRKQSRSRRLRLWTGRCLMYHFGTQLPFVVLVCLSSSSSVMLEGET